MVVGIVEVVMAAVTLLLTFIITQWPRIVLEDRAWPEKVISPRLKEK